MKPEAEFTPTTPEQSLINTMPTVERSQDFGVETETGVERGAEHYEQRADLGAMASDAFSATAPTISVGDNPVVDDDTSIANPVVAGNDDLIEKEWVDRAKSIVTETKDDPYRRGQEVGKLQSDYIKKRYGRELGVSE